MTKPRPSALFDFLQSAEEWTGGKALAVREPGCPECGTPLIAASVAQPALFIHGRLRGYPQDHVGDLPGDDVPVELGARCRRSTTRTEPSMRQNADEGRHALDPDWMAVGPDNELVPRPKPAPTADPLAVVRCDIRGCVLPATYRGCTADGEIVDFCERHADIRPIGSSEGGDARGVPDIP